MAQGLNRVFLIGMLAEQPELRYTRRGRPILIMRLGTREARGEGEEGPLETTYWHEVVVLGRRAESLAMAAGPGTQIRIADTPGEAIESKGSAQPTPPARHSCRSQ